MGFPWNPHRIPFASVVRREMSDPRCRNRLFIVKEGLLIGHARLQVVDAFHVREI